MALGTAIFDALLATFLYVVPAASLHLLVGGLANPRTEGWEPPQEAAQWKRRYRHGAWWGRKINLLLFAFFLVQLVMFVVLAANDCAFQRSHLTGAAANLASAARIGFTVGLAALLVLTLAAIPWAGLYLMQARRSGWSDPRRRDYFIVHLVFVPIALLLAYVAFGIVPRMLC